MPVVVVGGHSRNIGKSALVVDLIREFPEAEWTAVKITQYGHGICSIDGKECDCAPSEHPFELEEEFERERESDTSRFLRAGARHSYWLRVREGQLAVALPRLRACLQDAPFAIVESNSILEWFRPDLYLVVLEPDKDDFKESARRYLDRADAFVFRSAWDPAGGVPARWGITQNQLASKPRFFQRLGEALPDELREFVRARLFLSAPKL